MKIIIYRNDGSPEDKQDVFENCNSLKFVNGRSKIYIDHQYVDIGKDDILEITE